jgi:1-acyl-sn-glycerol-3-phosphate acyltransferase
MPSIYDLKPKFQNLLRPLIKRLAVLGLRPNAITLLALLGSIIVGVTVLQAAKHPAVLLLLPLWLFARMALNAIDGMMARELQMSTSLGAVLNEVGDVLSDIGLYLPLAFLHEPVTWPIVAFVLGAISLLSLFPLARLRHIHPVAAADYFERNRLIAFFTKTCFNILPIARKDISPGNHPLDRMEARLRAGKSLIVFPEGTRGSNAEMGPFRSGIARLLERVPDVPVVPAYLVNMGRSLPKGEFIPVPFFCEVRLGAPRLMPGGKEEMMEALKAAVLALKEPA